MNQVKFSTEDLRTPDSVERVLRQFQVALTGMSTTVSRLPGLQELAGQLAPVIRQQLQAGGSAPLNLQSLLPGVAGAVFTEDTHANRLSLSLPPTQQGAAFFETDRTVTYVVILSSGSLVWRYYSGTYYDVLANLPSDLGVNDANFRFVASNADQQIEYMWTGTEWVTIDYLQEVIDAVTNALTTTQLLRHRSTAATAANFGLSQIHQLDSSTNVLRDAAAIQTAWDVATNAAETARWSVALRNAGAALAEFFRVSITDIRFAIGGFFGIFTHANTANRTYTFPDETTNVVHETSGLTNNNFVLGAGTAKVKDATFAIVPEANGGTGTATAGINHTVPLGPLTAGGTTGSITFVNGKATANVDPT